MKQVQLEAYRIDMKYIRNLHNIDDRVLSVSPQSGKDERPFLGVIIIFNEHKYCVPLSKPKKKHEKMRDKIDFKKIIHKGIFIGVLNFNLMIPVEDAQIQRVDTKIRRHDDADTRKKKELLIKELEWCNEHARDLINTANVLYQKYVSGEKFSAREQCLPCLVNQAIKVANLTNAENREELYKKIFGLMSHMDFSKTNPEIVGESYQLIKQHIGCADPYKETKTYYNQFFLANIDVYDEKIHSIEDAVKYAIVANIIDFNPVHSNVDEDIQHFVIE